VLISISEKDLNLFIAVEERLRFEENHEKNDKNEET